MELPGRVLIGLDGIFFAQVLEERRAISGGSPIGARWIIAARFPFVSRNSLSRAGSALNLSHAARNCYS
jgi:hypothetical protein